MCYQIIKLNHAKDRHDYVDKVTRVLNTIIVKIKEEVLGSSNIGISIFFKCFFFVSAIQMNKKKLYLVAIIKYVNV